jgi:hypothetical protein
MTIVAVGDHGTVYLIAKAISASSTFQTVTNTATAADALEYVHYPFVDFDDRGAVVVDLKPPRAIVCDELGEDEFQEGGMHTWKRHETFWVSFDFPIPNDYMIEGGTVNQWAWFQQQVLAILKDVQSVGKTDSGVTPTGGVEVTYSAIRAVSRTEGPYRLSMDERDAPHPDDRQPPEVWHVAYMLERGF